MKNLSSDESAIAFKNIADIRAFDSTELSLRIEIRATNAVGFQDGRVRTVSESARTLKFDRSNFEES